MRTGPNYTTVQAVRDEGADPTLSDRFIYDRISFASRQFDEWTGQWFYPRPAVYRVDGEGQNVLPLPSPIIRIDRVATVCQSATGLSLDTIPPECYVVYNRHLTQGLTGEDDRDAPGIELVGDQPRYRYSYGTNLTGYHSGSYFNSLYSGNQNIQVEGVFGYTDPAQACVESGTEPFALTDGDTLSVAVDGGVPVVITFLTADFLDISQATAVEVAAVLSAAAVPSLLVETVVDTVRLSSTTFNNTSSIEVVETTAVPGQVLGFPTGLISTADGVTPAMVERAVLLMTLLDLVPLAERDERWEERNRFRLSEMKTKTQSVKWHAGSSGGLSHQTTGFWTGDPEIDNIISHFYRPPEVGFVGGVDHDLTPRPNVMSPLTLRYPPKLF